jgi:transposase
MVTGKADMALSMIQKLYRIEIALKGEAAIDKYQLRQEKTKPLFEQFYQWLEKANVPPKSVHKKASCFLLLPAELKVEHCIVEYKK